MRSKYVPLRKPKRKETALQQHRRITSDAEAAEFSMSVPAEDRKIKGVRTAGKGKKICSRTKGVVGEQEFTNLLKSHGIEACRGQQHAGGADSPDVKVAGLTGVHFEVKRTEAGNLYVWLEQAIHDAGGNLPIVAHRRNHRDWVAILPMEKLIELLVLREGTMF